MDGDSYGDSQTAIPHGDVPNRTDPSSKIFNPSLHLAFEEIRLSSFVSQSREPTTEISSAVPLTPILTYHERRSRLLLSLEPSKMIISPKL
ncbi:hypothetical protein BRARA_B01080 [Brassica rapa]|uniref:Uncharacterized protein n=1 Tax=Brassica campestris TaxID=3711 RepID=A0A398AE75_BRACM|nr:hypothetical protein BRARA_B01080 [Brassica rapa]